MMRAFGYVLLIACGFALAAAPERDSYKRPANYVPDEATAIKIAVAVWEAIWGAEKIAGEKPYHAELHAGVSTVTGSLPPRYSGGVALAEISKEDGRIIRIDHGK
jgi:NTF2 fold immunity protein